MFTEFTLVGRGERDGLEAVGIRALVLHLNCQLTLSEEERKYDITYNPQKAFSSLVHVYTCTYIHLCRLAWVDQKRRQVLYQRYIRATQVLYYQLPIKTSGENRQMKQLGIFAAVTIE